MTVTAKDVMDTTFLTLHPKMSVTEVVKVFKKASEEQKSKSFGLLVTTDQGELVGMVSMFDVLLLMRPKHIHIWGEMNDMDVTGFLDETCRRAKSILVEDIMTTDLISITPDTHLLFIVDIMIRKHLRRLPVLENGKVVGIVYISKVFYHLMERPSCMT
ncbi:CBS domain-containing protein [Desulforhabdus amnigena]|jgi:CBS domain-containing protein|uniref:Membrane protein n=1 Tax=Desulforhabdus amnigena TaxID=40218 RepID=A0A9W6D1M8_9BACT|nr:CBS domain-containing protein [Desulforhabdus amnigena]NLJ27730.1 CBS domain-containing protein [Deltaproteobacteria bacterium]GLI32978.1 membrane protein [Desulforhabdus amnigena]